MSTPWISDSDTLCERMSRPQQVDAGSLPAELPPYLEAFLKHLRLLIGVPFPYLVPHPSLLPVESIRFFYLDRSWTDRLVDGALSVGKVGSREQAHHQAHDRAVRNRLDSEESSVRPAQRGRVPDGAAAGGEAQISGFLLRSAAVSGWPHMAVRAFDTAGNPLQLLRLEKIAPAVLLGLFQGVPARVTFEEPHDGVQFGFVQGAGYELQLPARDTQGLPQAGGNPVPVEVRTASPSVVSIEKLGDRLQLADPAMSGSGPLAVAMLRAPYRQPFGRARRPISPAVALGANKELLTKIRAYSQDIVLKLMDPNEPAEEWGPPEELP